MSDIRTIVVATDLSDPSLQAIRAAHDLAVKFGSKVLMTCVVEDPLLPSAFAEFMPESLPGIVEQARTEAAKKLEAMASGLIDDGLDVEIEVPKGVAHREIVDLAQSRGADLIVMATHGRGAIAHALVGSTTERVLRHAPCAVWVVRDPRDGRA